MNRYTTPLPYTLLFRAQFVSFLEDIPIWVETIYYFGIVIMNSVQKLYRVHKLVTADV